jgi:hypothetical protein
MTAAHNTVVVDGKNQTTGGGACTLWADGALFRAVGAGGPELIGGSRYERTAAMIELSPRRFYVLDLFQVQGGTDHAYFLHSGYGRLRTEGLRLAPAEPYGHETQMRDFRRAERAESDDAPWSVTWEIEDRWGVRGEGAPVRLRYTDLTLDAEHSLAKAWISEGYGLGNSEAWIPRVMVRRRSAASPLASTFLGVIEPYEGEPEIAAARRRSTGGAAAEGAAVEVARRDGGADLLLVALGDRAGNGKGRGKMVTEPTWRAELDGELAWARRDAAGAVRRLVLCHGRRLSVGDLTLALPEPTPFVEIALHEGRAAIAGGAAPGVSVRRGGTELPIQEISRN